MDNCRNTTGMYIIYSSWSIARINEFLKDYKIGMLRVICDKKGSETNLTLILMENNCFEKLKNQGYATRNNNKGLNIAKFNDKALDLPTKGFTRNLFVPVPESFRKNDVKTLLEIEKKLVHLVSWDILPSNCWNLNAPLKSRQEGHISSGCFIVFNSDVSTLTIAKVKMLINDTRWSSVEDTTIEAFKCTWALDYQKKKNVVNEKKQKSKITEKDSPVLENRVILLEDEETFSLTIPDCQQPAQNVDQF